MKRSKIEEVALLWIEARLVADALRKERAPLECEHQEAAWKQGDIKAEACWKYIPDHDGGHYYARDGEWCASCRTRQGIHERYVRARNLATGRLAALHRVCKAELLTRRRTNDLHERVPPPRT